MSFLIGTKREAKITKYINLKDITTCNVCNKNIKLDEPILVQYQLDLSVVDKPTHSVHMSCMLKRLKQMQPDFWQKFIVEMI